MKNKYYIVVAKNNFKEKQFDCLSISQYVAITKVLDYLKVSYSSFVNFENKRLNK